MRLTRRQTGRDSLLATWKCRYVVRLSQQKYLAGDTAALAVVVKRMQFSRCLIVSPLSICQPVGCLSESLSCRGGCLRKACLVIDIVHPNRCSRLLTEYQYVCARVSVCVDLCEHVCSLTSLRVCVCVRACVRACARVRACACVRMCALAYVRESLDISGSQSFN